HTRSKRDWSSGVCSSDLYFLNHRAFHGVFFPYDEAWLTLFAGHVFVHKLRVFHFLYSDQNVYLLWRVVVLKTLLSPLVDHHIHYGDEPFLAYPLIPF